MKIIRANGYQLVVFDNIPTNRVTVETSPIGVTPGRHTLELAPEEAIDLGITIFEAAKKVLGRKP